MIIIGHRGAAGIEPENTIPSIEAAVEAGVDMVEFDVRVTKDKQLVVLHDANCKRIAGINKNIDEMTLEELNALTTRSGHHIPRLDEALSAAKDIPVLIDCKGKNWADLLNSALNGQSNIIAVTARDVQELAKFKHFRPQLDTYLNAFIWSFEAIYNAKHSSFFGVAINFWVLNPLVYIYAKRSNLKILIYTVNWPILARFLYFLYPQAAFITNVPHRLAPLAKRRNNT